jgi:hypothetical protein
MYRKNRIFNKKRVNEYMRKITSFSLEISTNSGLIPGKKCLFGWAA